MTKHDDTLGLDSIDSGLQAIFGERFSDRTSKQGTANTEKNAEAVTPGKPKEVKYKDAEWCQVSSEPSFFDKLKASAISALTFGGLNILIFYWEHIGLMDESIAVPSMCVCAALAGFGVGKNFARNENT